MVETGYIWYLKINFRDTPDPPGIRFYDATPRHDIRSWLKMPIVLQGLQAQR